MLRVDPKDSTIAKFHSYMVGSIAPRPIAFASTVDKDGNANLSPFSFFNAFGANPATVVFSPARSVRSNTNKHTLENIYETKEVVINVVTYDMVQQVSLASVEYAKEVNEFLKSGFTPIASEMVKPFRVKESPVQMECKVVDVKEMGFEGGAANLVICEIVLMHVNENILDEKGSIDPHKIDLVGRLGHNYYVRASGNALFEVEKPKSKNAIGFDGIPERIRLSAVLTGNNLGQLGNFEMFPTRDEISLMKEDERLQEIFLRFEHDEASMETQLHEYAKELLQENKVAEAWKVLLLPDFLEWGK